MANVHTQERSMSDGSKVYDVIYQDVNFDDARRIGFCCDSFDSAGRLAALLEVHTIGTFNA